MKLCGIAHEERHPASLRALGYRNCIQWGIVPTIEKPVLTIEDILLPQAKLHHGGFHVDADNLTKLYVSDF
jgi:hypothetical protein